MAAAQEDPARCPPNHGTLRNPRWDRHAGLQGSALSGVGEKYRNIAGDEDEAARKPSNDKGESCDGRTVFELKRVSRHRSRQAEKVYSSSI